MLKLLLLVVFVIFHFKMGIHPKLSFLLQIVCINMFPFAVVFLTQIQRANRHDLWDPLVTVESIARRQERKLVLYPGMWAIFPLSRQLGQ